MPNITRGDRMGGLLVYLAGPGRSNEHTEPHLVAGDAAVMAWHDDAELDRQSAMSVARHLDRPRQVFGVDVAGGSVWHCSLSLRAEEGQLSDERWAAISHEFVEGMGFVDQPSLDDAAPAKAPVRWAAVRHGVSTAGNDHVHIVVSLVREDGTKASVWNDRPRAQRLAGELEQRHGLQVLESRQAGLGARGVKPAELAKAQRAGQPEPVRLTLGRTVRGAAAAAADEAEFVRRLRRAGVLARPRYAAGRGEVVAGYSVAARPQPGERPVWYGGGHLARDLTLPRLRAQWPDTPQAAGAAAAEWDAAKRNRRITTPGREVVEPDPQTWQRCAEEVAELRTRLTQVPVQDRVAWARVARETSGAFAAWSNAVEVTPGPLAATADALARSSQLRAGEEARGARPVKPAGVATSTSAAMLLASAARGGKGTVGQAVLLRQLARTAVAVRRAHTARQEAWTARALANVLSTELVQVRDALPAVPASSGAATAAGPGQESPGVGGEVDREAAAALQAARAGQVPMRRPGSPVPNPLRPATQPPAVASRPPGRTNAPGRHGPGRDDGHDR